MKKPKVFYNPIEGSAPLSISWYDGPKGDAVEASNEIGVGFFAPNGELLSVIFDDVTEEKDHQFLEFNNYRIEIDVTRGKVTFSVVEQDLQKKKRRTRTSAKTQSHARSHQ